MSSEDLEIPSVEGFDDDFEEDAIDNGSPVPPNAQGTVVRLGDEPVDEPEVNDDEDAPAAPVAPMGLEKPASKKKGGRASKGATPAKSTAKTPQKATAKTPKSTKLTKTPSSATASKKRKAPEAPIATPPAKRGGGRAAASNAAAAIKESTAKRARAPNGTAKPAPKSNGTRGRKKAAPVPGPIFEEYEVEAILDSTVDASTKEHMFFIKWKGYDDKDNTWEPKKNLTHAAELIKEFEKSAKPAATATATGKPRGRPKKA